MVEHTQGRLVVPVLVLEIELKCNLQFAKQFWTTGTLPYGRVEIFERQRKMKRVARRALHLFEWE